LTEFVSDEHNYFRSTTLYIVYTLCTNHIEFRKR